MKSSSENHALETDLKKYLSMLEHEKRLQKGSLKVYEMEIRAFFKLCPTPKIESFLDSLKSQESSTVKRKLSILRAFLRTCSGEWKTSLENVKDPKLRKKDPLFLTDEEMFRLESAAYRSSKSSRDRLLIALGGQLGLRLSEILALKFEDLENAWLKITRKGGKEQRLPLTRSLQSLFHFYQKEQKARDSDFVFESDVGKPITSRAAQKIIKRLSQSAGIKKDISPHALRHSFATKLAAKGTSLAVVKEFLGHERITTTERYLHVTPEYLKDALNTLESFNSD